MNKVNLRGKHFRQLLQKNMDEAHGGRRDKIDVLRAALWFAEIKLRLNALSAYEIERRLEPNAFGKNKDGDSFHKNKWSKYEVGRHVPDNALVTKTDKVLPGTKRLLNHALWEALREGFVETETGSEDDLLRQLAPDIQKIVFQGDSLNHGNGPRKTSLSRPQLKMLERRAGIDSLACPTICARQTGSQGTQANIFDIGTSVYRVLLILCTTFPFCNLALDLFNIYRERVFTAMHHEDLEFQLDASEFISATHTLNRLLLTLEDNNQIGVSPKDSIQVMSDLLSGEYGFHIQFALAPLTGPTGPQTNSNTKAFADLERQKRFRQWGKEQIFSRKRETLPPPELW